MMNLGRKIVIVGVSASGKTVFAKRLNNKIKLPIFLMDAIMWNPGWNYIGDEETKKRLNEISLSPEWLIEGYIPKNARSFVFERADTIIYLNYPRTIGTLRYIKRWWKHRTNPREELEGSPEKFSFKFLRLVWTKGEGNSLNKYLSLTKEQSKIITLTSPRQASVFLQGLNL